MKIQRWMLLWGGLLTVLVLIAGLILPEWARPRIETFASAALHRHVQIEKIDFNPFTLTVTLQNVSIKENTEPFVDFNFLELDFEWASLWKRAPVIREITLHSPVIKIIRTKEHEYNFSDLIEHFSKDKNTKSELAKFAINNIKIENGSLDFDDQFLNAKQKIKHLEVALPFISTLAHRVNEYILPRVSGELNGTRFQLDAKSKPFTSSKDTEFTFDFKNLNLQQYAQYVRLPNDIKLLSASLSGQISLHFDIEKEKTKLSISGPLRLDHFSASLQDQPLINIDSLSVDLKSIEPLSGRYHIADIRLDGLDTAIEKNEKGQLNWQQALESKASADQSKADLEIGKITVLNSKIRYQNYQFNGIKLNLSAFSSKPGKNSPVQLSAQTDDGEQFSADIKISAQPLLVDGKLDIQAAALAKYGALLAPYFKGEISDGRLDVHSTIHFSQAPLAWSVKETEIRLNQFALHLPEQKKSLLKVNHFSVQGLNSDSAEKSVKALAVESEGGLLGAEWLANGQFNFNALLPAEQAAAKPAAPWHVQISKISLKDWALDFSDQRIVKAPPVPVRDISLVFDHFDTEPGSKGQLKLSGHWGNRGLIDVDAGIIHLPFSAQIALDLRNADAAFLQPYFTQYLNIELARGLLNAKGNLQLATKPKFNGRYRGAFSINHFYALDKQTSTAFLKWNRLDIKGIDASLVPLKVDIAEIELDKYFSRLILSSSGRLNLQDIVVHDGKEVSVAQANTASAVASAPASERLAPVNIKKVVFSNGDIRYSDFFIKPNFTANLNKMGGVIYGLSSVESARAQLDLHGFVDKTAPMQVSGTLNPLSEKIYLDLKGGVKNYDLTSASTYSAKYAGYGVEKGKMSMDIAYKIEGSKLLATNKIFLDQLTLSEEKIESADATQLPVKLALSLLTDRRGQINLNLPIEGSLEDPQFSISGILWQVVANVLEKIVTSPFDALANAMGHEGATLSHIEFAAGSDKIDDKADLSIKQLAGVLAERPGLKLDIQSVLNPVLDKEGLKAKDLQRKIRQIKLAGLGNKLSEDDNEFIIGKDEYPDLLGKVYKREKFDKPANFIGMDKSLSVAEMEKLIFEHTDIKNDDLNALGQRRALQVKAGLLAAGVDEARLFMVKALIGQGSEQRPQVKFDLK
ncbi:DUF748 domain-containing protein [Iodobacter sp. LRB]|uniref:DUF748 domain-containing protein n=1 Tax=unclassified Iodobacter TaxID=235634 RepID=UPI000C10F7B2|nr:DUF748 domain-containing protein [Iodobacter sp. BJB302]PHV01836.1 hypothetical protein CSQ88_09930 [Iodobacter sp. BJB302]